MPKPDKIEFNIGQTIHGQTLRLVREKQNGREVWTLCRDEADQRDDRVFISGLTSLHLRQIGEIGKDNP